MSRDRTEPMGDVSGRWGGGCGVVLEEEPTRAKNQGHVTLDQGLVDRFQDLVKALKIENLFVTMGPQSQSPISPPASDPGAVKDKPMDHMYQNDDRFLYKHQRRDQRKKVFFPKNGGPSILVFVKDNPNKRNINKTNNMYNQYRVLPHLPFIPTSALPYDPLRLPAFPNQNLLMSMLPPLPPLPHPLQQNSIPPQFRQRPSSNPNISYAPFVPPQTCAPEPTAPFQDSTFVSSNNLNNPATVPSNYAGRMSAGNGLIPEKSAPALPAYFYPYFQPQLVVPEQRSAPQMKQTSPPNQSPFIDHARTSLSQAPDYQIKAEPKAATRPPSRQYTHSLPEAAPANYNNYYPKCSCNECLQFSYQFPEPSQKSQTDSISNDTGFSRQISPTYSNDSGFSEPLAKGDPGEVTTSSPMETGDRPLVFCDQNNPTFSLDSTTLDKVMGMAHQVNIEKNEPHFMDQKRQIRKQIPCRNLNQTGMCHFGETCWFSHHVTSYRKNLSLVN